MNERVGVIFPLHQSSLKLKGAAQWARERVIDFFSPNQLSKTFQFYLLHYRRLRRFKRGHLGFLSPSHYWFGDRKIFHPKEIKSAKGCGRFASGGFLVEPFLTPFVRMDSCFYLRSDRAGGPSPNPSGLPRHSETVSAVTPPHPRVTVFETFSSSNRPTLFKRKRNFVTINHRGCVNVGHGSLSEEFR